VWVRILALLARFELKNQIILNGNRESPLESNQRREQLAGVHCTEYIFIYALLSVRFGVNKLLGQPPASILRACVCVRAGAYW